MDIPEAPWITYADTGGVPPRSKHYMNGYEGDGESYYDDEDEEEQEDEDDVEESGQ